MGCKTVLDERVIQAAVEKRVAEVEGDCCPLPLRKTRFLSFSEMLSEPLTPNWLIGGYLTAEALAVLYGESTAMKSFLALDMGLCIASGTAWHGAKIVQSGPVAYIAAEGGVEMRKRLKAWALKHGTTVPPLFFTLPESVPLSDPAEFDRLVAELEDIAKRHGPLRLIVFDTLARTLGGLDENSSRDMGAYVAALDRLKSIFKCSVLVVHHAGLADTRRARGSSALRAAVEWEMLLEIQRDVRRLSFTKSKDFEPPAPLVFRPKQIGVGCADPTTGDEVTSCVLELAEAQVVEDASPKLRWGTRIGLETLRAMVKDAQGGRVRLVEWRAEAKKRQISTSEEVRGRNQACQRAMEHMVALGLAEVNDDFCWLAGTGGTAGTEGNNSRLFQGEQGGTDGTHPYRGVPSVPTPKNRTVPRSKENRV